MWDKVKNIFILYILLIPLQLKANGIWPIYFYDNSKNNLFAPLIQWNKDKTVFRPFFIYKKNSFNLFYPLVKFSNENGFVTQRIFPVFNRKHTSENYTNLFPLFWGKTEDNKSYGGFFPFYGKLINRFGYNEIKFFLWPLWTEKSNNKMNSYSFLWPFFGFYREKNFNGLRFWPFFSIKKDEKFFLWPFFIFQKKKIDVNQFEYRHFYFPFFIHTYSKDYNYKTFLWPLIRFNKRYTDGYFYWALWPLLSFEKNKKNSKYFKFSFFPFYKKVYQKNYHKESYLWILFQNEKTFLKDKIYSTKKSFLLINRFEKNYKNKTSYKNIWPFFEYCSYKKDYVFKLFEPFPFKIKPVYELYSTFFNIFYIYRKDDKKRINFLWGLFVYEKNKNYKIIKFFQIIKFKFKNKKNRDIAKVNIDSFFSNF